MNEHLEAVAGRALIVREPPQDDATSESILAATRADVASDRTKPSAQQRR